MSDNMSSLRLYRVLAAAGHSALAVLTLAFLVAGDIGAAVSMTFFFVVSFAYHLREESLPNLFDLLIVIVALVNGLGWTLNLYETLQPYYDLFAHFLTTAVMTLILFHVVYRAELGRQMTRHPLAYGLATVTLALGIGTAWELLEYITEGFTGRQLIYGIDDTMSDMFADLAGAILAAGIGVLHHLRNE